MMNETPAYGQYTPPAYQPPVAAPAAPKPPQEYTAAERLLIPAALLVAVLYDRLAVASFFRPGWNFPFYSGIFWLSYLVILYAVYWKKLARNKLLWLVGGLSAALCVWNLFFDYRSAYGALTCVVIPAVLMAHAQFLAGNYKLKEVGKLVKAWFLGWVYTPFSGIFALFGAAGSVIRGGKKSTAKKAAAGSALAAGLLLVIIPLLCGADQVFGYYIGKILGDFNLPSFAGHLLVVVIALMLFYSFLWNIGFASPKTAADSKDSSVDALISCIVTGTVVLVYALFCAVQFTYLFAGAGLPGDMTYSEYAREGFAQTIAVCAVNLLIFGVFLRYSQKNRPVSGLLAALLGLTAAMLVSGSVRLGLYIDAYGITWLRLLSAWFIVYMAVVLVLCAIRMVKEQLPLVAVCAFILLGWYAALGYMNPDALIVRYNVKAAGSAAVWVEENDEYLYMLSDDGMLVLLDSGIDPGRLKEPAADGYSLSSCRLRERLREMQNH